MLLAEIEEMQEDIRKLREDIENYAIKRDVGVARIAAMQKESRGTIAQDQAVVIHKDQKRSLMAGDDKAIRELCALLQDAVLAPPLQYASVSEWAQLPIEH